MFKNYFKIAIRQLRKQKMYSVIKIGGFALSIAACFLIALFIKDELSYDRSYPDANRLYRLYIEYHDNGTIIKGTAFQAPFAKAMKEDFPEIENSGRFMPYALFYGAGSNQVMKEGDDQNTYEEGFSYADQGILDMLKVPMVYGNRSHALLQPNTIVLSKKKADKYFPHQNPVGKIIYLNNNKKEPYTVGGVMKDFPSTSHLKYDFLLTLTGHQLWEGEQDYWMANNYDTYILLRPGTDMTTMEKKFSSIVKKYIYPVLVKQGNTDASRVEEMIKYRLQPITDIHLRSYDISDNQSHGDIRFVWLFGAIACFILFIACINFINLSTAKSANRAKEVGLRRVVGSYRSSLVRQFLTESMLFSFLSFILAILLAWALLPFFNTLSAKSLSFPWSAWWLLPVTILSAIIIGLLAGLYPSFYLSAFKPINILKGQLSKGSKNSTLRSVLVVFQFTTSIILIIGTIIVNRQTQFILHKKMGFEKDQVMLIQGTNTLDRQVPAFKNELLKLPNVKNVAVSDYLPINGTKRDQNTFWNEGKTKEEAGVGAQIWRVDYDYINTMGMSIKLGRNFSKDMLSDSQAIIINQAMANKFGFTDPIGKSITNGNPAYHVVGVLEDFNFESMRENIAPLCLVLGNSNSIISVKVSGAQMGKVVGSVSALWKSFSPHQPIRYTFLDESFANMYADVQRMGRIFSSFAILAIIIACLGLFALSAFMAEQRSKEISIRKVLGASVGNVTILLSKDFIRLVLISVVIASPIAWFAMSEWLLDFVYRINIGWEVFLLAAVVVLLIALATISFQSVKAAIANPVKNLRNE